MAMTRREISARYRARHLEQERARSRACSKTWYASHRDVARVAMKEYNAAHREKRHAQQKAQRQRPDRESGLALRRLRWIETRAQRNEQRRVRRAADVEAAKQREAAARMRPGYSERAVARTAEWNRKHPEQHRALARKQDAKRRAIERECFVEAVDPRVVFERDNGVCGICRGEVDVTSPWEVDHIVPILRGGLHSYANVQLAHRKCNRSKGARMVA